METSSNKAVDTQLTSETHLRDEYNPLVALSAARKGLILFFLCLAQFLDTFMNSALFAAIPPISVDLNITNANSVWLISGYQLTFAALLLVVRWINNDLFATAHKTSQSGRLSDLYNPSKCSAADIHHTHIHFSRNRLLRRSHPHWRIIFGGRIRSG